MLYIEVGCCICYSRTYYRIIDNELVHLEDNFGQSVIVDPLTDKMYMLGERSYNMTIYDMETNEFSIYGLDYGQLQLGGNGLVSVSWLPILGIFLISVVRPYIPLPIFLYTM